MFRCIGRKALYILPSKFKSLSSCDMPSAIIPPAVNEKTIYSDGPPLLRSNQGKQVEKDATGWMRSTSLDTPMDEMRERYDRDGYIWVKNLIPREEVYNIREQYARPSHTL